MAGHIAMGAPGELREYVLMETDLYSKAPANQFAAKLATGAGDYDDLQNWSYLVLQSWEAGAGKRDVEGGGFLFSTLETRYPEELRLNRAANMAYHASISLSYGERKYVESHAGDSGSAASELTIGSGQAITRLGRRIYSEYGSAVTYVKVTLRNDNLTTAAKVAIYTDNSGMPGALLDSAVVTLIPGPGYGEYIAAITETLAATTDYHITIEPNDSGDQLLVPVHTAEHSGVFAYFSSGSWTATTAYGWVHDVSSRKATNYQNTHILFATATNLFTVGNTRALSNVGPTLEPFGESPIDTMAADITSIINLGSLFLVGVGPSNNAWSYNSSLTPADLGVPADLFATWNGYVFRSVGNDLYYTSDLSTWTGPIEICPAGWQIRGMAGLGDNLYISCDDALYFLGVGDLVGKVTTWGSIDSINGRSMVNYQGALIIPAGESIFRFDGNAMLPIGLDKGEGLPAQYSGTVRCLVHQNNWLFAAINATSTTGSDTVWVWDNVGWHHIATLPAKAAGPTILSMCYQRNRKRLHIGTNHGVIYSIYSPDVAREPTDAANAGGFRPSGYLETDWFFGGLKEVPKDMESIYISGEGIDASNYVEVYWMDDASTDWELLGTVTTERQEIRWSDYTTRPSTRQLRLRLVLYSKSVSTTPLVRAMRLKYHPMVSDWFRWSFPISCSDYGQEFGGPASPYTAQQKRDHLDSLITQIPPFIFRDLDGKQYEVKVMGCQIQHTDVQWVAGEFHFNTIYSMTIEAIRPGVYSG